MIKLELEIEIVSIVVPLQDGQLPQFVLVIPFNTPLSIQLLSKL